MISNFRISRRIAGGAIVVTLAAATAAAAGLMYPDPVSSGALGPDWQCTRTAFVFTSCSRVVRFKTAAAEAEAGKASACPGLTWRIVYDLLP